MTQPAKGQEPSMEEILASIRRIIADEPVKVSRDEALRNDASRQASSRPAMSRQATPREDISREEMPRDAFSPNDVPRPPRNDDSRIEPLRNEGRRSEEPSREISRYESPMRSIARNDDVPQPRRPLLPQPPARAAPLSAYPLSSHVAPEASPPIPSVRAAPAPVPDAETQREEIDAMLAEFSAGSRQTLPAMQEPAQEPAEPAPEPAQEPASDILELTEQIAAAQSLPAAEFDSPDDLAEESYEEETPAEREEPEPFAVAPPAAEPHRHMRDHVRDIDRENERDSYRDTSEDGLISATTTAAVDSAFNALAQTVLVQNGRTLEDLVREMLRPMLKSWLDDNLPSMVERLVRAEIERVSRGR